MTTKTNPEAHEIAIAESLAIAAGRAAHDACAVAGQGQQQSQEIATALNKLSLRFAELALELAGGEARQGTRDESARGA